MASRTGGKPRPVFLRLVAVVVVVVSLTLTYFYIRQFLPAPEMSEGTNQIEIDRVKLMPNVPSPYQMKDWRTLARVYDEFVFNFDLTGDYLPLIRWDRSYKNFKQISFDMPSYVGDPRQGEGGGEAINCVAAVLGATLVGIDKSNQSGHNWVAMCENWFNVDDGEYLFLNDKHADSGQSFWYEIYPHILFYALVYYYPNTGNMQQEVKTTADKWYDACYHMGGKDGVPNFGHTAFDFDTMTPFDNGIWKEPDAAAGIAWLEYAAYIKWGEAKYLQAADWGMQFLQETQKTIANPFYEVLLPFGAYTAARMNAELGRDYDVEKFLNWCFDGTSSPRPGWGVIASNWGGYDCFGLVGSNTDGGGYAFAMNTFSMAAPLVPLVRYDARFARSIGKWMLNAANNARLFYSDSLPEDQQSSAFWKGDPNHVVAYEGLRKNWAKKSPYATGDALGDGWAATDFGLYGSSHVGIFGGIIGSTNDEKILQLDCLVTDFYHDEAYPTYLYYNPYVVERAVEIDVGPGPKDLYDAVTHKFLERNVTGLASFTLSADSAAVIVVTPVGGETTHEGRKMMINGVVVDYDFTQASDKQALGLGDRRPNQEFYDPLPNLNTNTMVPTFNGKEDKKRGMFIRKGSDLYF